MRILALDTTSESGSVALQEDGEMVAGASFSSRDGFAHILFGEMASVLREAGWSLTDVDCFAAANGPGSFTGVRVGLTAIKGLAEALQKPVAAVSNLRALAHFGTAARRAVMIDARRGDIYAAVYDQDLRAIVPDVVIKLSDWLKSLDDGAYEFITAAGGPLETALEGTSFRDMVHVTAPQSIAVAVAQCAYLDAKEDALISPLAADANYVRRADAELHWRDR